MDYSFIKHSRIAFYTNVSLTFPYNNLRAAIPASTFTGINSSGNPETGFLRIKYALPMHHHLPLSIGNYLLKS